MAPKPPTSLFIGCRNRPVTSLVSDDTAISNLLHFRQLTKDCLLQPLCLFRGSFLPYQTPYMDKGFGESSLSPIKVYNT
jgi:hypothetical protein